MKPLSTARPIFRRMLIAAFVATGAAPAVHAQLNDPALDPTVNAGSADQRTATQQATRSSAANQRSSGPTRSGTTVARSRSNAA